jgi:hypothetical protein
VSLYKFFRAPLHQLLEAYLPTKEKVGPIWSVLQKQDTKHTLLAVVLLIVGGVTFRSSKVMILYRSGPLELSAGLCSPFEELKPHILD